jgi:cell division protein FtsL
LQALELERERSHNLDVEFGQLQLEMSSWAAHTRIERIAREKLGMQPPDMKKVQKLGGGQ